jgi:hypothetical protein
VRISIPNRIILSVRTGLSMVTGRTNIPAENSRDTPAVRRRAVECTGHAPQELCGVCTTSTSPCEENAQLAYLVSKLTAKIGGLHAEGVLSLSRAY